MSKGTGFDKFQAGVLAESPIDFSVRKDTDAQADSGRPAVRRKEKKEEPAQKDDAAKDIQICVFVDYATRRKIDELKFVTGEKIKELIIEAISDLHQKRIGEKA